MKRKWLSNSVGLSLALLATFVTSADAALIGSDNASSNAYLATDGNGANDTDPTNNTNGWVSGDDGFVTGAGAFLPWALTTGGTPGAAGFLIGDSRNLNAGLTGANINSAGNASFGMFGTSSMFADAVRPFDSALTAGQTLTLSLGVNFRNGQKGFDLRNSSNTVLMNFNIGNLGAGDDYTVQFATTGNGSIGTGYNANTAFNVSITQTSAGGGTWTIVRGGGITDSDSGTYTGVPTNLKFYVNATGGGSESDLYVNNLAIVPEPASTALIAATALGFALRRRRRA